uniref:Uncharacterized protein n=1 Tax=Vespula pensylvanica TaxID=30213 RepID=A0A834KUB8_VESPE|nr:hypothetical protein H0235_013002 [Vespula pensylvanica]
MQKHGWLGSTNGDEGKGQLADSNRPRSKQRRRLGQIVGFMDRWSWRFGERTLYSGPKLGYAVEEIFHILSKVQKRWAHENDVLETTGSTMQDPFERRRTKPRRTTGRAYAPFLRDEISQIADSGSPDRLSVASERPPLTFNYFTSVDSTNR